MNIYNYFTKKEKFSFVILFLIVKKKWKKQLFKIEKNE